MRVSRLGGFRGCRVLDASVYRLLIRGQWIRIRIQNGQKIHKKRETNGGSFMVLELDALSRRQKTFLQAWSFIEALEEKKYIAIYDPKM
jgi:hypothetical protein